MNKLKKIGLSALAGTLASLSAQAGELTVTGTAEISYTQRDSDEITGNPFGMNKALGFAGSGELDNGWVVGYNQATTDAFGLTSASLSLDMGSLGKVVFDQGSGADMGTANDNVVPVAFEEADAGMATGLVVSGGAISPHGSVNYKLPAFSGLQLGVSYSPSPGSAQGDGSTSGLDSVGERAYEWAADWSPEMVPGLRVGGAVGSCENCVAGGKDLDEETWFATYAYGPLSIGYQTADESAARNYDTDIYGVSFNVNDSLSVSYQYGETDGYAGGVTAEFRGISAAYNIGPLAIKFTDNSGKNINGITSGVSMDDDNRELNLSMSF